MTGALALAIAHARHHGWRSSLLVLSVFVAALLPLATRVLAGDFQQRLLARARSTPLLAGAKGSRFDLVMAGLYFRRADIGTLTMRDWRELADTGLAEAIPLNTRFTARGFPVVAAPPDYYTLRSLRPAAGAVPTIIGEAVLGSAAARSLGLGVGDVVYSDQRELYDISRSPSIKLRIVGVFAPLGTPDDQAVFTDIKTAWALEGLAHAHADAASAIPAPLLLDRTEEGVVVSEELVEDNDFRPENLTSFHVHADQGTLPVSAVVLVPRSPKQFSILKARVNAGKTAQVVAPEEAVEEMLGYVARLTGLLDALSAVILLGTVMLIGLVTGLSIRVRSREIETLMKIGVPRTTIAGIFAWELALLIGLGCSVAAAFALVLGRFPPDLVRFV